MSAFCISHVWILWDKYDSGALNAVDATFDFEIFVKIVSKPFQYVISIIFFGRYGLRIKTPNRAIG